MFEEDLDAYFKPKKEKKVTEELLRKLNRGIGYTKTAPGYVFKRVRWPLLNQLEEVEGERHGLDDVLVGFVVSVAGHELHGPGAGQGPAA